VSQPPRLAALRHNNFRLLWGGQMVSNIGSQMQIFTINWHVYELLQNRVYSFALLNWHLTFNAQVLGLGMLGAVRILPIFLFAMFGGLLADRHDRRLLIIWAQVLAGLSTLLLTILTFSGYITVPLLYIFTAINVAISAFDEPAQTALYPELVPLEHLPNAATLYSLLWDTGTITGPALAGLLIASTSLGVVYLLNTLSFIVALLAVIFISHRRPVDKRETQEALLQMNWHNVVEGFRFVWGTRLIRGAMFLDCAATFFASARTMLPFVAGQMLHVGVRGYSLLAIAQPIGSFSTGIILALQKRLHRQGPLLIGGALLYGLATAFFGLSTSFMLSAILFGLTGVGDMLSTVVRSNIRQQWTPDALRGRMNGVQMIVAFGGPQMGELEAGIVAALIGVPLTIFTGGIITVFIIGWFAWRYPELRKYNTYNEAISLPHSAETNYAD
jgi:MFS family permease